MASLKHDLERLLNAMRVKLAGASDAGIKQELWTTLHEFCNETGVWWETLTFPTIVGQWLYPLTPTEPGEIVRFAGCINANRSPVPASMPRVGVMHLEHKPTTVYTLYARVILVPQVGVSREGLPEIPDTILPLYAPAIEDGLLGRMMSQTNKPFTNERMALYHLRRFRAALTAVRSAVNHQNTFGVNAWVFPPAYSTRNQKGGGSETHF